MQYRRIGRSGLKVSEIAIGGWLTFGGSIDQQRTSRIITAAIDHGINFIDLADIYARGDAETAIGRILPNHRRGDLVISSKLFWPMSDNINDRGLSRKHIMESIDRSLKRLGTDYLDIYFCHRFDPETEITEIVRAMDDLVRQGKILYWGTSVWNAEQITAACSDADRYLAYAPVVEQPRYNLLDRHIEPDILPTCRRFGMGLTVWSPLAQGLLTGKYAKGAPDGSRGATTRWLNNEMTPENHEKVRQLSALAQLHGLGLSHMALAWVLRLPEISAALTGATDENQLRENVRASGVVLSAELLAEIDRIIGTSVEGQK